MGWKRTWGKIKRPVTGSLLGMLGGPAGVPIGFAIGQAQNSKVAAEGEANQVRQEMEQARIQGVLADFRQQQQKLDLTLGAPGEGKTRRVSTPALSGESLGQGQDQDNGTVLGDLFGQKQSSVSGTF